VAQKFGYTLHQIKELLDSLPNKRTPTVEDWEKLSKSFKKVWMQKSKTCKSCMTPQGTALRAAAYP